MNCLPEGNFAVFFLVVLFGMGSWVAVNGLWVELPILVDQSVEGWNLPSYYTIIIQIANIGPVLYTLVNRLVPDKFNEKHGVFILVVLGAAASLLLVFFWKDTSYIGGVKHSTGLLFCIFLLSLVDCTSSVVFLPYMSRFKPQYISALYIGEGLSGLVPSLVAIGQGVGKTNCVNKTVNQTTNVTELVPVYEQPNFPVEDFFYFLFSMMVVCGIAFSLLHYLPYCKREHVPDHIEVIHEVRFKSRHSSDYDYKEFHDSAGEVNIEDDTKCHISLISKVDAVPRKKLVYFLVLIGFLNALNNGVLPSVSSYASKPYGDSAYHLSATLSNIVNPVMCFIMLFLPLMSAWVITAVTFTGFGVGTYILVIAAHSPAPPLMDETSGAAFIVLASILVSALVSFSKVSIAMLLRLNGRKALLLCGIVTQVGSALGAILMFVIVNQLKLFHDKPPCT